MNVTLARVFGILVTGLALFGLFTSGYLFNLTNSDLLMDLLRLGLGAYLLYAGFVAKTDRAANSALLTTGVVYLALAIIGLVSPTIGGLLPSGLTGFDIFFHLVAGAVALYGSTLHSHSGRHIGAHA